MKPWIRRLVMMLGILIPGFLMIFLQVHPMILFSELGLIAAAILFASGSITPADLKGLRRGGRKKAAAEPEGVAKAREASPEKKPGGRTSRFREIPRALGNVAALIRERWQTARAGKPRMDAIDRVLDRTIASPSASSPPATIRMPVPGAASAGSRGPGGDPFLDLLNANFEPALPGTEIPARDVEIPPKGAGIPGRGPEVPGRVAAPPDPTGAQVMEKGPLFPATDARKETTTVKGPAVKVESVAAARAPGPAAVPPTTISCLGEEPAKATFEITLKDGEVLPRSIPAPVKEASPSLKTVATTLPKAKSAATGPEAKGPAQAADQEILSFTSEPGGTMDDLLATLKADAVRVKRSDDSSLLRNLKGVRVQGKELVDDLSALLKELR
ncbi:MAG: hypothetical protein LUO87_03875 [Methanomicrobiales archaeon]|nr:hypothetical protein [Methanomicrobiales archaeon]